MVSEADVEMAYRLFLGRAPENKELVAKHARSYATVDAMRHSFMASNEFQQALGRVQPPRVIRPWNSPYTAVQTDVSAEIAERLTRHIENNWTKLGETEPHWSVLTHEAYKSEKIQENERAFYDSGETTVAMFLRAVERSGIDPARFAEQSILELGCGVGRITFHLAKSFESVIGVDISPAHLRLAEQAMAGAGRGNVEFVQLTSLDLLRRLPRVDAFLSIIVLQHNPPPLMKTLLANCLSRLRPNGIGYFQLPYYAAGYSFSADTYLKLIETPQYQGIMEMHVLPQPVLFEVVAQAGCQVVEIMEDEWSGSNFQSCSVLVRKL